MKPETAYKFIKRFTLTNTTIMTILFVTACDSLWHAFCIIATLPVFDIGMIAMYEHYAHDYTNLLNNLTEKKKKEMPYIRWDEVIKDAHKDYLWGLISITFCNILFSGFIIFMLWQILYEGRFLRIS